MKFLLNSELIVLWGFDLNFLEVKILRVIKFYLKFMEVKSVFAKILLSVVAVGYFVKLDFIVYYLFIIRHCP